MRHSLVRGIGVLAVTVGMFGLGACDMNHNDDNGTRMDHDARTQRNYPARSDDMRANPGAGNVGGAGSGNFGSGTGGGTGAGSGSGSTGQGSGSGSSGTMR